MSHGLVGTSLEHYRLDAPLGAGAMSEVYLGTDTNLGKKVAVKVIHPSAALDPDQVTRFEREARTAARLQHPHVAVVYYAGSTTFGAPFYAMELIRGWSLDEVIESRIRFRLEQALALFAQACSGLDAASKAGVFHRDIKPANLMVGRDGVLKVVDFGLAKLNDDASLTRSGTMMGTPTYMAPEIARGTGGDFRSDIYSLGVTFFHMLAGFPPFESDTTYGVLLKHIQDEAPLLSRINPGLPERLSSLVMRMLSKEPEARPTSHAQVQFELGEIAAEMDAAAGGNPQLAFCSTDDRVTVALGTKCSECGNAYVAYRRPERFHVDVVGWHRNEGRDAVAKHIGGKMAQAAVARQLEELPYRAAQRLPRERARELQRTLYDMGADVELSGADASGREHDPGKRPQLPRTIAWPPPPKLGAGEGVSPKSTVIDHGSTQLRMKAALEKVQRPSLVNISLAVAVVVLAGLLLQERLGKDEDLVASDDAGETRSPDVRTPTAPQPARTAPPSVAAAPVESEDPVPTPEVEATPEAEGTAARATPASEQSPPNDVEEAAESIRSRWFDTDPGAVSADVAQAIVEAVDAAADEIGNDLGLRKGRVALTLVDEPLDLEGRGWTGAAYAPDLVFPARGAGTNPSMLAGPARGLVTRAAVTSAGKGRAPAWLVVGLSLYAEQGPTTVDENAAAVSGDGLFPTKLLAGTQRNDAPTELALRSFAGFLVEQHGWRGVHAFAERLGRGDSPDEAADRAWRSDMAATEGAWQDACGLE